MRTLNFITFFINPRGNRIIPKSFFSNSPKMNKKPIKKNK